MGMAVSSPTTRFQGMFPNFKRMNQAAQRVARLEAKLASADLNIGAPAIRKIGRRLDCADKSLKRSTGQLARKTILPAFLMQWWVVRKKRQSQNATLQNPPKLPKGFFGLD